MKVTPVASPHAMITAQTSNATDARARAIAKLSAPTPEVGQQQAQETPVQNPNQVSVEELSAIQAPQAAESTDNIADTVETQAEETKPTPPKEDPALTAKFTQLARQERALRAKAQQQEQALKQREAALAAREAELTAKGNQYNQDYISKARLKQDALGVLEAEGLATYDDITQRALSRQPVDPMVQQTMQRLEAKIQELEQQAQQSQKSYQDQQQASYQEALKQIERDTKTLVQNDPEFETIKTTGAIKDVVDLIERTWKKDGILLTVDEAAKEVEEYLVEEAIKFTRIDKIKKRMEQSNASAKKSDVKPQAPQQQTQMKTLTNSVSNTRQLSARERAIAAMEGRLKS